MFDVSWTDPERETVGERRTRKEQNGGSSRKQNVISRRSSMRSSKSTESPAAAKPSLLNIFGSGRKPAIDRAKSQSKLYSEDVNDHRVSIYTSGSETSAPESFGLPATRIASNSFFDGRSSHSDTEQSNPSEPPDSVFSGWTERTSRTDSSWGSVIDTSTLSSGTSSCIVQPLSPTSFVTQSTEVTVSPRDSIKAEEQTATIVRITAAGTTIPVEVSNVPDSPTKTASPPSTFAFPLPLPLSYAYPPSSTSPIAPNLCHLPAVSEEKSRQVIKKQLSLAPTHIAGSSSCSNTGSKRLTAASSNLDCRDQATSPVAETWKPPETWECPASSSDSSGCSLSPTAKTHPRPRVHRPPPSLATELSTLPSIPRRSKERDIQKPRLKSPPTSAEILHLQRSIRRMEAASKKIMLERLREEWTEIADASVYRELELEKQMWMLTALRSFDGRRSIDGSRCGTPVCGEQRGVSRLGEGKPERRRRKAVGGHRGKVLSLFENHASASSLVAIVPKGTEVHHLSTAPLSPKQYLNILPLTVPSATPQLPYASNIFSSIHAFCLPSLLPSSSIPAVLKECYRVLVSAPVSAPPDSLALTSLPEKPSQSTTPSSNTLSNSVEPRGGTLCLTILDPSPLPGTLGPRLRTWLDDHLVLNLEKQFRCINPSRLLPDWLADAGLRAKGSTVMYVKFFASVPNVAWSRCSSTAVSRGRADDEERDLAIRDEIEEEKQREKELEDERIKQELKSVVGRMLWKEMWGSYVLGEKWWWEDEEVVDECERMGTVWEYAVIEAVKGE